MRPEHRHVPVPSDLGEQGISREDVTYEGSRYSDVVKAIFANPYYRVWGAPGERPLPQYEVTLWSLLRGLLSFRPSNVFCTAAGRTLDSFADLRWGMDGKGFRRLLHPNGVCVTGRWVITEENNYSGYFRKGSEGLVIARISSHSTATTRGHRRSFSIVGKLYPTTNPDHKELLRPANFFTQDDLGGSDALRVADVEIKNAPDVRLWNRGIEAPILIWTGLVFRSQDQMPDVRQVYPIAELGKSENELTHAPEYLRFTFSPGQRPADEDDYRNEILSYVFDRGDPEPKRAFSFDVSVADDGYPVGHPLLNNRRHVVKDWKRIGRIIFDNAVASYNGDFVLHFHHPKWRTNRNDPTTVVR